MTAQLRGLDGLCQGSRVVTVDAGTVNLQQSHCFWSGFEVANAAGTLINAAEETEFDAILYYEPEAASPMCDGDGATGTGTIGACFIGLLSDVNHDAAVPPYHPSPWHNTELFWAGCFVRYQKSGEPDRANVGAHELGHLLGLGHASGNFNSRKACTPQLELRTICSRLTPLAHKSGVCALFAWTTGLGQPRNLRRHECGHGY